MNAFAYKIKSGCFITATETELVRYLSQLLGLVRRAGAVCTLGCLPALWLLSPGRLYRVIHSLPSVPGPSRTPYALLARLLPPLRLYSLARATVFLEDAPPNI